MNNVITLRCTCEYLVGRAARHRRAGRYDEAMALLWKAKNAFGPKGDVELEAARVYADMGCEEEAARAYLRVVRLCGKVRGYALLNLALSSAQRGDIRRAASYQAALASCDDRAGVDGELAAALSAQLHEAMRRAVPRSRRQRARALEHRAVMRLQEGKAVAAERLMTRALSLHEPARGYTMLACCRLLRLRFAEAVDAAQRARRLSPGRVQTLCVLSDAYAAMGDAGRARNALYLAAMRARTPDDLFASALESAKHGEDILTLRLTDRLLRLAPYHTHGMRLRACALLNLGRTKAAARLFGRLCGLLPEDTVCAYFYRLAREGKRPQERLTLGVDVTREEGVSRASALIATLYESPDAICEDGARLQAVCRLCGWALRSSMTGSPIRTVALIVLCALDAPQAREVLLDALTDPQMQDSVKRSILQALTAKEGFAPYHVDIDGMLVRMAAGGISENPGGERDSRVVQRAYDALSGRFPDAPKALIDIYLTYLRAYGSPRKEEEAACAAALVYIYHWQSGGQVAMPAVARRHGVSVRRLRLMLRRFARAAAEPDNDDTCGGDSHEVH